jgi:tetratricopeptide (TPR) repeat protein
MANVLENLFGTWNESKRPITSENFKRAMDIMDDDPQTAYDCFSKELKSNPQNGYAFFWMAYLQEQLGNYGTALGLLRSALQYIPTADKEYRALAYSLQGDVHEALGEADKALADRTEAIEAKPDEKDDYMNRGDLYYRLGKYDKSDADYKKAIAIDETDNEAYGGLGRNADARGKFEEAIQLFSHALALDSNYPAGYALRGDSYFSLKKYPEALDDTLNALRLGQDNRLAFENLQKLAAATFPLTMAKLTVAAKQDSENGFWPYCLGYLHEFVADQSREALPYYIQALNLGLEPAALNYRIACCLNEIGHFVRALEYCSRSIELDDSDTTKYLMRAYIEYELGQMAAAEADCSTCIEKAPDQYLGYSIRGWMRRYTKNKKGAIDDYTMVISLQPDKAEPHYQRGYLLWQLGRKAEAVEDFKQLLTLEKETDADPLSQQAYFYLDEPEKAVDYMEKTLARVDNKDTRYEAACLYSLMGNIREGLWNLDRALQMGWVRFELIRRDPDLDNLRTSCRFKVLTEGYEDFLRMKVARWEKEENEAESETDESGSYEEETTEIPYKIEQGTCTVPCQINKLPLNFTFDTGAADVTLSKVEADFMLKNGFLSSKDIGGVIHHVIADGSVTEDRAVLLREVNFGGLSLKNVRASISQKQQASLLLGQSVLGQLGSIEIDNAAHVLRIKRKVKTNK